MKKTCRVLPSRINARAVEVIALLMSLLIAKIGDTAIIILIKNFLSRPYPYSSQFELTLFQFAKAVELLTGLT